MVTVESMARIFYGASIAVRLGLVAKNAVFTQKMP